MLFKIAYDAMKCLLCNKFVGRDENGNSYYESKKGVRLVVYSKNAEPTTIPPEWHIWLHYTDDAIPVKKNKRTVNHISQLAERQNSGRRVENYYESWRPNT